MSLTKHVAPIMLLFFISAMQKSVQGGTTITTLTTCPNCTIFTRKQDEHRGQKEQNILPNGFCLL